MSFLILSLLSFSSEIAIFVHYYILSCMLSDAYCPSFCYLQITMAVVATRNMRFHPYASKTAKFGSPMPATPLFNSTTLDSLSVLADVTPLMISNITLSPITPSGRDEIFRGEEVMSCDFKRSKSFRRIRDLCKLKPRRKIQLWKPEENKGEKILLTLYTTLFLVR